MPRDNTNDDIAAACDNNGNDKCGGWPDFVCIKEIFLPLASSSLPCLSSRYLWVRMTFCQERLFCHQFGQSRRLDSCPYCCDGSLWDSILFCLARERRFGTKVCFLKIYKKISIRLGISNEIGFFRAKLLYYYLIFLTISWQFWKKKDTWFSECNMPVTMAMLLLANVVENINFD